MKREPGIRPILAPAPAVSSRISHFRPTALAVAAVLVVALAISWLPLAARANSATIKGAIVGATVTPTNPVLGSEVTTNLNWCVPDGTQAGDTFTVTLSKYEISLPSGFQLADAGGAVVANAVISDTTPAVITFTMTSYAATHLNVCGTAFVNSGFSGSIPAGQTVDFTTTTNDGQTFTTPVTPTGHGPVRTNATKFASWTSSDQGRTDPKDALSWYIQTGNGPFDGSIISDTVPSGQSIDCATARVVIGDTSGPNGSLADAKPYSGGSISCTASKIIANVGAIPSATIVQLSFSVNFATATGASGQATFTNTADVKTTVNGKTVVDSPQASITQGAAGGTGGGTSLTPSVTIVKKDVNGNDANTAATAAALGEAPASVGLTYLIANDGTDALVDLVRQRSGRAERNGHRVELHVPGWQQGHYLGRATRRGRIVFLRGNPVRRPERRRPRGHRDSDR
jgi:Bacterial Ig domain